MAQGSKIAWLRAPNLNKKFHVSNLLHLPQKKMLIDIIESHIEGNIMPENGKSQGDLEHKNKKILTIVHQG
jgi:hypothetical protein